MPILGASLLTKARSRGSGGRCRPGQKRRRAGSRSRVRGGS